MVCLDTTFLIDLINGRIDMNYLKDNFNNEEVFIPSPVITELIRGINLDLNLKNMKPNEGKETKKIISFFPILNFELEEAALAGEIQAELINKGKIVGTIDTLIAAICLENQETLVTKNKKHFSNIEGLKIKTY